MSRKLSSAGLAMRPAKENEQKTSPTMSGKKKQNSDTFLPRSFEEVLEVVGDSHRYQVLRMAAFVLVSAFICAAPTAALVFSTLDEPISAPQQCPIPNNSSDWPVDLRNFSKKEIQNAVSPPGSCTSANLTEIQVIHLWNGSRLRSENATRTRCNHDELTYGSYGRNTITKEFRLVCDKAYFGSLIMTIGSFALAVAQVFFLGLPDWIGRKQAMYFCWFWYAVSMLLAAFMPNVPSITVFTSLFMATTPSTAVIFMTLMAEVSGVRCRTAIQVVYGSIYGFGSAAVPLIAYFCSSWRHFYIVLSVPGFLLMLTYFWVDESPRWLLTRGKAKRARKILMRMAATNKMDSARVPSEDSLTKIIAQDQMKDEESMRNAGSSTFLDLFRHRNLLVHTLALIYLNTAAFYSYEGLNLLSGSLGDNPYLVYTLMALVEVPGSLIAYSVEKFGRILPLALLFGVSGLLSGIAGFLAESDVIGRIVLCVTSKMCVTPVINTLFQLCWELYPTVLRGQGSGLVQTVAYLIGCGFPYLVFANRFFKGAAEMVFGFLGLSSAVLILFMPESLGKDLMDSVQDSDSARGFGFASFKDNLMMKSVREHRRKLRKDAGSVEARSDAACPAKF